MGNKIIVFHLPAFLVVILGGSKKVLDALAIIGAGGVAVESKFQFKPWATLAFILARIFVIYIMKTYINQTVSDDDDK